MNKKYYTIKLEQHGDERGNMCVIEGGEQIPFSIARVFYDYNNVDNGQSRGDHANRHSRFAFICLAGSCEVELNDGHNSEVMTLDDPSTVLCMEPMVWKSMRKYSPDSVLLILSDKKYDRTEYIRDFNEFLKETKGE